MLLLLISLFVPKIVVVDQPTQRRLLSRIAGGEGALEDLLLLLDVGEEPFEACVVAFAEKAEFLEELAALGAVMLDFGQLVPHVLIKGHHQ